MSTGISALSKDDQRDVRRWLQLRRLARRVRRRPLWNFWFWGLAWLSLAISFVIVVIDLALALFITSAPRHPVGYSAVLMCALDYARRRLRR